MTVEFWNNASVIDGEKVNHWPTG